MRNWLMTLLVVLVGSPVFAQCSNGRCGGGGGQQRVRIIMVPQQQLVQQSVPAPQTTVQPVPAPVQQQTTMVPVQTQQFLGYQQLTSLQSGGCGGGGCGRSGCSSGGCRARVSGRFSFRGRFRS